MNNVRPLTDRYAVSPQIEPADLQALAEAGFTRIICNRPDAEVPVPLQAAAISDAAKAAGLEFVEIPLTHQTMTRDNMIAQAEAIDGADGKVLAYCASGNRSSIIWALGRAGADPVEDILAAAQRAGYDLSGLRPTLAALAQA